MVVTMATTIEGRSAISSTPGPYMKAKGSTKAATAILQAVAAMAMGFAPAIPAAA